MEFDTNDFHSNPDVNINVNPLSTGDIVGICFGVAVLLFLMIVCCAAVFYWISRSADANAALLNGANPNGAKQVGVASPKVEPHHKRKKSSHKKLLVLKRRSSHQSAAAAASAAAGGAVSGPGALSSAFSGRRGSSASSLKPSSAGSRKSSALSNRSSRLSKKSSRLSKKGSSKGSHKSSKGSQKHSLGLKKGGPKASKKSAKASLKHTFGLKKGTQGFLVTPNGLKAPLVLKKQAETAK